MFSEVWVWILSWQTEGLQTFVQLYMSWSASLVVTRVTMFSSGRMCDRKQQLVWISRRSGQTLPVPTLASKQRSPDIMRKCRLSRPLRDDDSEQSVIYKQFSKPDIYPHCIKRQPSYSPSRSESDQTFASIFLKLHAQIKSVSIFITFRDHFMQLRKTL